MKEFPTAEVLDGVAGSIGKFIAIKALWDKRRKNMRIAKDKARELGRISRDYEFAKIYKLDFPGCDTEEFEINKLETLLAFLGEGWDKIGVKPLVHGFSIVVCREDSRESISRMMKMMAGRLSIRLDEGVDMATLDAHYDKCPLSVVYPDTQKLESTDKAPLVILMFDFPDDEETRAIAEFFRDKYEVTVFY